MYDYNELSSLVPELKEHVNNNILDYNCPRAVRLLNQALFLKELGLTVELPSGYLCPTVINRRSYIEKIEEILNHLFGFDSISIGIDIGTGTSCVYPLISCKRNPNWSFLATDIDDEIINHAVNNVKLNNLQDRITIIKNTDPNTIFPPTLLSKISGDKSIFLVCNPPFYTDIEDLELRASFKRHKSNNMVMNKVELGTDLGGEIGFIKKMISESTNNSISESINLFSCMFGLKESLLNLIEHFESLQTVPSYAFEPLRIKHTTRYLLFWSFTHQIPKDTSSNVLRFTARSKRQQIVSIDKDEFDFQVFLKKLKLKYSDSDDYGCEDMDSIIILKCNKWSRKARRSTTPIPLPAPIEIEIECQEKVGLIFKVDKEADWETFLGFVNHLRKEITLENK